MNEAAGLAYPRERRLTKGSDFSRVFKQNISCRDANFRILAQTGNGLGFARLGQVVSRKVDSRAVTRNRIKRLVRESFRQRSNGLKDVDFVVLAQRAAANEANPRLLASLNTLWQRIEEKISDPAERVG